ncbi:MAG: TonB-dependent receptor [Acidobacteriota bacterium]
MTSPRKLPVRSLPIRAVVIVVLRITILALVVSPLGPSSAAEDPANVVEAVNVDVVAPAPLPGIGIPRDHVPSNVQSLTADDLRQQGSRDLTAALDASLASIVINASQSNAFQPDVLFRGFTASPLLGSPIGLSVYLDGVRVNESFGDTVLWDLIPQRAISSVTVVPGSNPVFGMNTLGGALAIHTKSGRYDPGVEADVTTGSWGRRDVDLSYGGRSGNWDAFVAGSYLSDDGWRVASSSRVRQLFAKAGWHSDTTDFDLSFTGARNDLFGNGLLPEPMLARSRTAVYTTPDITKPELSFINLSAGHALSPHSVLSGTVYWRDLTLDTTNGDVNDDADEKDTALAVLHTSRTVQRTSGAALQWAWATGDARRGNALTLGVTWDRGRTEFAQLDQDGAFDGARAVYPLGEPVLVTRLHGVNEYAGFFVTDTFTATQSLHITASARYNHARVETKDRSGDDPDLDGKASFSRLNPAIGFTYAANRLLTLYGSYNEGFRVPTPVESTCADPTAPCALPVGFVSDPPLDPVVSRTVEFGLRGQRSPGVSWNIAAYRTNVSNDILFTAVGLSQGFFANVSRTRRQGIEAGVRFQGKRFDGRVDVAETLATYESAVDLFNPVANEDDPYQPETIHVTPGDRLPGIPRHTLKLAATYHVSNALSLGAHLVAPSSQFLRGDEANQHTPLGGYSVAGAFATYAIGEAWSLRFAIENLFDRRYATIASYGRSAFAANGAYIDGLQPVERFVSPAAPRTVSFALTYHLGPGGASKPQAD